VMTRMGDPEMVLDRLREGRWFREDA
jgi:hypothetical protein